MKRTLIDTFYLRMKCLMRHCWMVALVAAWAVLGFGCAALFRDNETARRLEAEWAAMDKSDPQTLKWLGGHSDQDMFDYEAKCDEARRAFYAAWSKRLCQESYTSARYEAIMREAEGYIPTISTARESGLFSGFNALRDKAIRESYSYQLRSVCVAVRAAKTENDLKAAVRPKATVIREIHADCPNAEVDGVGVAFLTAFLDEADTTAFQSAILYAPFLLPELRKSAIDRCMDYASLDRIAKNWNESREIVGYVVKRLNDPQTRLNFALREKDETRAFRIISAQPRNTSCLVAYIAHAPREWSKTRGEALGLISRRELFNDTANASPLCDLLLVPDLFQLFPRDSMRDFFLSKMSHIIMASPGECERLLTHCKDISLRKALYDRLSKKSSPALAWIWLASEQGRLALTEGEKTALCNTHNLYRGESGALLLKEARDEGVLALVLGVLKEQGKLFATLREQSPERRARFITLLLRHKAWLDTKAVLDLLEEYPDLIAELDVLVPPKMCASEKMQEYLCNTVRNTRAHSEVRAWAFSHLLLEGDSKVVQDNLIALARLRADGELPGGTLETLTAALKKAYDDWANRLPEGTLRFDGFALGMPMAAAYFLNKPGVTFKWDDGGRVKEIKWTGKARFTAFNEWEDEEFLERFPEAYGLPEFRIQAYDREKIAKLNMLSSPLAQEMIGGLVNNPLMQAEIEREYAEASKPLHCLQSRKYGLQVILYHNGSLKISSLDEE